MTSTISGIGLATHITLCVCVCVCGQVAGQEMAFRLVVTHLDWVRGWQGTV